MKYCRNLVLPLFSKCPRILRFLVSGGTAAGVNLGLLYILTEYAKIFYLYSEAVGFSAGFLVTFFLQKFWTFGDNDMNNLKKQMLSTLTLCFINFFLNLFFLFLLTDIFGIWYFGSQAFVSGMMAITNYFLYKKVIFSKKISAVIRS